jgi:aminoglycoside phosphotransferase (APT) family kinase protein
VGERVPLSRAAIEHVRHALAPGGRVLRARPMHGGISSNIDLLHLETRAGNRLAVVVRRYGPYWQRTDPGACAREFHLLRFLFDSGFPAPRPLLLDADGSAFDGAPTVVMARVPGRPVGQPRDLDDFLGQLALSLARLHALPVESLDFLPQQHVAISRALAAEAPQTEHDALLTRVADAARTGWPAARANARRRIVHGDFWPGNVLWWRTRLSGVIDWESPSLGEPTRDVATCRGDLSVLFGMNAADRFRAYYEAASSEPVRDMAFWDVLVSVWAVAEMDQWVIGYHGIGRRDVQPEEARRRIRTFAQAALDATSG